MRWKDLNREYVDNAELLRGKNPYEILRIDPTASMSDIKRAYRMLVKVYHPDVSHCFMKSNNEEIIKLLNQAYNQIMSERNGS